MRLCYILHLQHVLSRRISMNGWYSVWEVQPFAQVLHSTNASPKTVQQGRCTDLPVPSLHFKLYNPRGGKKNWNWYSVNSSVQLANSRCVHPWIVHKTTSLTKAAGVCHGRTLRAWSRWVSTTVVNCVHVFMQNYALVVKPMVDANGKIVFCL